MADNKLSDFIVDEVFSKALMHGVLSFIILRHDKDPENVKELCKRLFTRILPNTLAENFENVYKCLLWFLDEAHIQITPKNERAAKAAEQLFGSLFRELDDHNVSEYKRAPQTLHDWIVEKNLRQYYRFRSI